MAATSFEAQRSLSNEGVVVHALAAIQSSIHVEYPKSVLIHMQLLVQSIMLQLDDVGWWSDTSGCGHCRSQGLRPERSTIITLYS